MTCRRKASQERDLKKEVSWSEYTVMSTTDSYEKILTGVLKVGELSPRH